MPIFVKDGPDIPECLLQAHEDGGVVFFCGAGISSAAGLPDFEGLIKNLYENLQIEPDAHQKRAVKSKQFDSVINLLENNIPGGRQRVREEIMQILKLNPEASRDTSTHKALLELGRSRDGKMRLVTTNFDRLFEEVITDSEYADRYGTNCFKAPDLPVSKNRWDGRVYLHGLLPQEPEEGAYDNLIVSSGDYGRAYLDKGWAARFVSELFRNYMVCFVGYSINDFVIRYMTNAIASDESRGEASPKMFAFGSYSKGKEGWEKDEWRNKGITPILYKKHRKHAYLHRTLQKWSDIYKDGSRGKKMIITEHATKPPPLITASQPDFVDQVLWAITDESAAKHFADMNPVPPLEWLLGPFSEKWFKHEDLIRFWVTPNSLSPWMSIVDVGNQRSRLDPVMFHLARWLTRHLDDRRLVLWLVDRGSKLHEKLSSLIHEQLKCIEQLEENSQDELEKIRENAPKAIPDSYMRSLWNLFLTGKLESRRDRYGIYDWIGHFKQHRGLTLALRMELLQLLSPRVAISKRNPLEQSERLEHEIKLGHEIVLFGDNIHYFLQNEAREEIFRNAWQEALPSLLQDLTMLLRDALDLKEELSNANSTSHGWCFYQPSIKEHSQNRKSYDWTALIDLTRDAWLATKEINPRQAKRIVEDWWDVPYSLFKRLVFFAAASSDFIAPEKTLNWLLADNHRWLWLRETQREAIRLLVDLVPRLDKKALEKVEKAVVGGPPDGMFRYETEADERMKIGRKIWLRLMKMESAGITLGGVARSKLGELSQQNPEWSLAEDERDEFPFWREVGDGEKKPVISAPSEVDDLVKWLEEFSDKNSQYMEAWCRLCRDNFENAVTALCSLAKKDKWLGSRWAQVLGIWIQSRTDSTLLKESWQRVAPVLSKAPDSVIKELSRNLSFWLSDVAKVFETHKEEFFLLIDRLLGLQYPDKALPEKGVFLLQDNEQFSLGDKPPNDLIVPAINHPIGRATQALLDWWYRQELEDAEGIRDEVKPAFTRICCKTQTKKFRHGRLILAAHSLNLFKADEEWTQEHLIPLFDWQRSETEAAVVWQGFLSSSRIYFPLLSAIKPYFLKTAEYYNQLGECSDVFAEFLTFVALGSLDSGDIFTKAELRDATGKLLPKDLQRTVQTLSRALGRAGEQRKEYWRNRIKPYLKQVWPQESRLQTPEISGYFARFCIEAGDLFPEVMDELRYWLQPLEDPYYVTYLLDRSELCKKFPSEVLKFLGKVVGENMQGPVNELERCLDNIESSDETLASDDRFIRLRAICDVYTE